MILQYYGYDVSVKTLASYVPSMKLEKKNGRLYGADPNEAYTGNILGVGWGVYAKPMQKAIQEYIDSQDQQYDVCNISGATLEEMKDYLRNDRPVQVWVTASMTDVSNSKVKSWYIKTASGDYTDKEFDFPLGEHSVVLTGYDDDNFYINDPLRIFKSVSIEQFEKAYTSMGKFALVLEKNKTNEKCYDALQFGLFLFYLCIIFGFYNFINL